MTRAQNMRLTALELIARPKTEEILVVYGQAEADRVLAARKAADPAFDERNLIIVVLEGFDDP
jgi:hypothetical protein